MCFKYDVIESIKLQIINKSMYEYGSDIYTEVATYVFSIIRIYRCGRKSHSLTTGYFFAANQKYAM